MEKKTIKDASTDRLHSSSTGKPGLANLIYMQMNRFGENISDYLLSEKHSRGSATSLGGRHLEAHFLNFFKQR